MHVQRLVRMTRTSLVVAALAAVALPSAAEAASYGKRTLKPGTEGRDVKLLQKYLTRAGFRVDSTGYYGDGTAVAQRRFEESVELRVDGTATRRDQKNLKKAVTVVRQGDGGVKYEAPPANNTAAAVLAPDGRTAIAPASAPQEVKDAINAANEITRKPYRYGGGHGSFKDSGYDCSGAVSYALHGGGLLKSPLDSTSFMSWGEAGKGQWITVYAHGGHAYVVIAGLRFDTSGGGRGESGPRWRAESRSASGFTARHPAGL
jgi:cell wall-associated NlpC family hydrolase